MRRKWLAIGIILLFIGVTIAPAIAQDTEKSQSASRGNWLYVGGSGQGNYSSIQDAINDSNDGDTLFVYDDSSPYYENISITRSIRLLGENPTSTLITCQKNNVIKILANNVTIEGFTIANLNYNIIGIQGRGNSSIITNNIIMSGGVHFDSTYNNTITNNLIQGKLGIYLSETTSSKIDNNTISVQSTGIYLLRSSMIRVTNNFLDNMTQGIMLIGCSSANITNNVIANATHFAIFLQGPMDTNQIIHNMIMSCNWGIFLWLSENQLIKNNIILDSVLGIKLEESNHNLITQNFFRGNTVNALFNESSKNKWNKNFWDKPRILPYIIIGTTVIFRWTLKWLNFDMSPAQEPYDIPRVK